MIFKILRTNQHTIRCSCRCVTQDSEIRDCLAIELISSTHDASQAVMQVRGIIDGKTIRRRQKKGEEEKEIQNKPAYQSHEAECSQLPASRN